MKQFVCYFIGVERVQINIKKPRRVKRSKTVRSFLDDDKDVERRKQLVTIALCKLNDVWIMGNKLKTSTKTELYKCLVKSIYSLTAEHGHLP